MQVGDAVPFSYAVGDPVWLTSGDQVLPAVITAHEAGGPLWSQFYEVTLTDLELAADRVAAHRGELSPRS